MSPDIGGRVIGVARSLVGSHYINGGYGATPGQLNGFPGRPGGIGLIAAPDRLNPAKQANPKKDLAVFAATMTVKKYCVCAGNYNSFPGGRTAPPSDWDLNFYLGTLQLAPVALWQNYYTNFTPRRAYGPGPKGGDIGGRLVWGQSCQGVRHFDCVGFISFCIWSATGREYQLEISQWRNPAVAGGQVFDLAPHKPKPSAVQAGDIIIKADHHIGFVSNEGEIIEAQDTDLGVRDDGRFNLAHPSDWTHLVRLPLK